MFSFLHARPFEENNPLFPSGFSDFSTHKNLGKLSFFFRSHYSPPRIALSSNSIRIGCLNSEDETKFDKNGPLNGEISHNSNIDSPPIKYLGTTTIRVEEKITFESPHKDQIEGNVQIPNLTSRIWMGFYKKPLSANNLFSRTDEETPNQASIDDYNLISINNESSSNQGSNKTEKFRTDNLKWQIYISPMICLKAFLNERFDLNIDSYDCKKYLGKNYKERMEFLKESVRELLNKHGETKDKIDKKLESCDNTTKKELNNYLNMTYKKLSENYEKIKAKLRTPSTIIELISRENEIQSKREKYRNLKKNRNNNVLHELRIGNFEEGLEKLFEGIKRGKWQRGQKEQEGKIKIFKIRKVKRKKKRRGET